MLYCCNNNLFFAEYIRILLVNPMPLDKDLNHPRGFQVSEKENHGNLGNGNSHFPPNSMKTKGFR
jgi:hypothetical protein